jgi:hypothetical protein
VESDDNKTHIIQLEQPKLKVFADIAEFATGATNNAQPLSAEFLSKGPTATTV